MKKVFSATKSAFEKGELVLHSSDGKIGVIDYGPDSDGDYKVKYHDGNRSSYVKASGLKGTAFVTNKGTFTKGELVLHLSDKRAGVIDSGPDSDGDYKVKYDDGSQSGYVKADGLKGTSFIMSKTTFTKGDRVLHKSDLKVGVIDYGPDGDGDYKVNYGNDERSGYVKADGLLGKVRKAICFYLNIVLWSSI